MPNLTQAEGHLIGNHTYSHMQLTKRKREKFKEQLNMIPVLWTIDPLDWCS
ncbi:MAG: polysaccharide deacetylase family protein, partial [Acetatifactor sp.]|nr:polysaccharide deacetylase family protein [Acetatifactor sp.]